jgi:diguanylate cyclase (GGDEF)-like protein/PAS domain S-box-containing protein
MDFINRFFRNSLLSQRVVPEKILNWIFMAAIAFIVIVSGFSITEFRNLLNANDWVIHTYDVIVTTDNIIYDFSDIIGHQRGYLITGDKSFMKSQPAMEKDLNEKMDHAIVLTQDRDSQNQIFKTLKSLIAARMIILRHVTQLKDDNQFTDPVGLQTFYQGHTLGDEIKALAVSIKSTEYELLEVRNAEVVTKAWYINRFFIIGSLLSIFTLFIAFYLFNAELRKRHKAERHQQALKSQLNSVIEGAHDMIAAVDKDFRYFLFNNAYQLEFEKLFAKKIQVGMTVQELLAHDPESRDKLVASWKTSLDGKEYIKKINFNANGQRNDYEINSSLVRKDDGDVMGAVHIIRNITIQVIEQEKLKLEYEMLHQGNLELKERNQKITLMVEMSDVMLACGSLKELCQVAAKYSAKILNFSSGIIYIMHPSKNYLESFDSWGKPTKQHGTFTFDACWALRLGRIHNAAAGKNDLICSHVQNPRNDEILYLCVPLMAQNDIYGLLYFEISQTLCPNNVLPESERLLVNAFAELTALSLANVRLRENLHFQSVRDPLTSLYNRRYLEEFLLKQLHQSERTKSPLSVLMMDLDHFKRINDFYGHDAGDLALKELGKILSGGIRAGDLACRYGGEEFLLVLFNTDAEAAKARAEILREEVSHIRIKYGTQDVGPIQISIGIAVYPQDGLTSAELIETADKALYEAKNSGRNKSVLYADMK